MSKVKNFILKFLGPLILAESKIVSNERASAHFQFITVKGKSLKNITWIPGQKIQIKVQGDEMRSYTPSSWNSVTGEVQTLIYMHGKGPGALWARDVTPNTKITLLGPRGSLSIDSEIRHVIFFGDETTFGLAHALKKYTENKTYDFLFEANDIKESSFILEKFELKDSSLFKLDELDKIALEINKAFLQIPGAQIVLSGKQQSIVALREKLYAFGVPREAIMKKVYWGWKDDPNGKLKS